MSKEYGDEPEENESHSTEEFSFLQETIKDEPVNKKKLASNILKILGLGLIFGIAASLGFFALKPWAETKFQKNPKEVTIPKDKEDEKAQEPEKEVVPPTTPALTIDNYRQMNRALYAVVQDADKSIVEVTGVRAGEEWMKKRYDTANSVSGVLIANNGQQLLILSKSSILKEVQSLTVTFIDGSKCNATLKKKDENAGIAIISVALKDITEATLSQIKPATLGNSNALRRGDPIIALGKQFGYAGGLGYGVVSSMKNELELADGQYDLICTDIAGSEQGTGVIANSNGEIVGIIDPGASVAEAGNPVTALAISNLKEEIEILLNGGSVPYIGLKGIEVTEETAQKENVPQGVYVKEVEADSPAMTAGIQGGDIITSFEKMKTTTMSSYYSAMMDKKVGNVVKLHGQRRGANGYVDIEFTVTVGSKE
ncbi:MAG: S1C family serine protease [Lachnospiraceae bacterium]